jgi:hypothetical protein
VLRLVGVLALAVFVARLLPAGSHVATPVPESAAEQSFLTLFTDAVARTSPWLVTSLLLAAVLDASVGPQALAPVDGPWLSIVVVALLSLAVQVEAVAVAPVLGVLVHEGLPPGAALAAWVVIAAPGERSLLLLLGAKAKSIAGLLAATLVAGVALGSAVELFGVHFTPLLAEGLAEALGPPATIVLLATVLYSIWKLGLRGWFGSVLSHDH